MHDQLQEMLARAQQAQVLQRKVSGVEQRDKEVSVPLQQLEMAH